MKAVSSLFIVVFFLLLINCKKKSDNNDETAIIEKYFRLEKLGWKSNQYSQHVDQLTFAVAEVPLAYYILKDLGNEDIKKVDSIDQANKSERIFEFEFVHDKEPELLEKEYTGLDYTEGVKYISFKINEDFYVVTSKHDTIRCSGSTFERSFKIFPSHKILLFFTGIPPQDQIQLVYQDRLFKKGTLKFKFIERINKIQL